MVNQILPTELQLAQLKSLEQATVALIFDPWDDPRPITPAVFTGFVVDFQGHLLWLTAGHVLEDIKTSFSVCPTGKLVFRTMTKDVSDVTLLAFDMGRWFDLGEILTNAQARGRLNLDGAPYDSSALTGIDVGVYYLGHILEQNLQLTGMKPIDLHVLCEEERKPGAHIVLCGIPRSSMLPEENRQRYTFQWKPLQLRGNKLDAPRLEFDPAWPPEQHIGSVKGMSGGPIAVVGFEKLTLIGIQSAEDSIGSRPTKLYAWDIQFVRQWLSIAIGVISASLGPGVSR